MRKLIASYAVYPTQRTADGRRHPRRARSSSSWCRRARWSSACAPAAPGSPRSTRRPASAPRSRAGKEVREFDGRRYVLETALRADFALVRAPRADRHGNLVYRRGVAQLQPGVRDRRARDDRRGRRDRRAGRARSGGGRHARHLRRPRRALRAPARRRRRCARSAARWGKAVGPRGARARRPGRAASRPT